MDNVVDMRTWKNRAARTQDVLNKDATAQRHDAKINAALHKQPDKELKLSPERQRVLDRLTRAMESTYTPLEGDADFMYEGEPARLARTCGCGCQNFAILIDGDIECVDCGHIVHNTRVFQDGLPCENDELTKIEEAYQRLRT